MENDNCEKVILTDLEGSGHNSYPNNYQRLIGERKTVYIVHYTRIYCSFEHCTEYFTLRKPIN
jgi:hypothetical protein